MDISCIGSCKNTVLVTTEPEYISNFLTRNFLTCNFLTCTFLTCNIPYLQFLYMQFPYLQLPCLHVLLPAISFLSWKGSRQSDEFAAVNKFSLPSLPVSVSLISFHWINSSEDPQWHHFLHRQRWSYCSHSSWSLCRIRHCRSFDSAIPSQKLVWFWGFLSVMVFFVSQLAQTCGFTERYHLFLFHFILWCSTKIRSRLASFHSLYDSSWLSYIQEFFEISSVCWWHSTVHFVQIGWFSPIFRNSFFSLQWHCSLDTQQQTHVQSI